MDPTRPEMPAPPAAAPPGVLWAKLHTPQPPATLVQRDRLLARLSDESGAGMTLICAPAGFGKSALLAEACRHGWNGAWLTLDQRDNDAVRFGRQVAATLDRALVGQCDLSERVEQAIRGGDHSGAALSTCILNGLESADGPVVLVLDDYHLIDDHEVHDSVRMLVEHAPRCLRVAMATRADPPLPLARWRAAGALTEVRTAELRFTVAEAASLLANVAGSTVTSRAAEALAERTEGWAAGLQLAGLSLAQRGDAEAFAESFSGSHRFVLDYLTEEVLDQQTSAVRDFLLQTSVLERLSGPLCDAVTGRTDSQALLEQIEAANLFLIPLDDVRGWWRYHHLFADLLGSRYRRHQALDVVQETHRRAATWHHERGGIDDTIRHALEAGDPTWAAQVIERHADELLFRREGATLRRWFAALPEGTMDSRRLVLAQARVAVYGGRLREAEQFLLQADEAEEVPLAPFEPSLEPAASPLAAPEPMADLLRAFVAHLRGDVDTAEGLARATLAEVDEGSALALIAGLHLASAPWLRGNSGEAEALLVENIAGWRAVGAHDRAAWSAHRLGQVRLELGKLDEALQTYEDVLTLDAAHSGLHAPAAGVAHIGIAQVACLRGELGTALEHARLGVERCRDFIDVKVLGIGLSTLARVQGARGETAGMNAAIAEAERIRAGGEVVDLLDPAPAEIARLLVAHGDTAAAARWIDKRGLAATTSPTRVHEPAHLALAAVLLAQGRPTNALRQLDPLAEQAGAQGRHGSLVEIETVRALARSATGDAPGAVQSAARAVELAAGQGVIQPFVEAGDDMATLLASLAEIGEATDAVRALLERVKHARGLKSATSRADSQPLVVPLTERELDVLLEMSQGRTNKQIAADLYVSLNTVKKHVTHIFEKLGVTNRTAAVAHARDLGMLE